MASLKSAFGLLCRAALACACVAPPLAAHASDDGPAVRFERQADVLCANYAITARHHLYPGKLAAFEGSSRLALSGVPKGKPLKGSPDPVADAPFRACAKARPGAATLWIDQSCLAAEGVCMPPRAFDVDGSGRARQLSGAQAAQAYARAFKPAQDSGWGAFAFKPR